MPLQFAANQKIKFLIGATKFDIGFDFHRIHCLCQRIEEFMQGNRLLFVESLMKIFPLEHLADSITSCKFYHIRESEFPKPIIIIMNDKVLSGKNSGYLI